MSQEIRERLQSIVNSTSEEGWGYFCYEDKWCEAADQSSEPCDCQDCSKDYWGEDYDPELDDTVLCECGSCEAHDGSLLDVEITRRADGSLVGVTAVVGTGGPHIELDTQYQRVNGYWGNEEARAYVSKDTCGRVEQFFDEVSVK